MTDDSVSLKEYIDKRFDNSDRAVQAALAAQEKAILKAEVAAEERFKLLNELRGGVATKAELEALIKVVDELKDRINRGEGKGSGFSDSWKILLGALSGAAVIYGFFK